MVNNLSYQAPASYDNPLAHTIILVAFLLVLGLLAFLFFQYYLVGLPELTTQEAKPVFWWLQLGFGLRKKQIQLHSCQ
jgi:hypothetical protein